MRRDQGASPWRAGLAVCALAVVLLLPGRAQADPERYQALPMPGGVFIMDTREGHAWTWSPGSDQVSASGENPRMVYQGNVRKNMRSSSTSRKPSAVQPAGQDRF